MIKELKSPLQKLQMSKKPLIAIGISIIIILVGFLGWKIVHYTHRNTTPKSSTATLAPLPKEATVTLTKDGFTPSQVAIKIGSAVRWINKSGSNQTVNSDNYPTNQLHKELNFGVFANDSSVVYTFIKPGIYGYHNQFHHEQEGKIIVTQ